MPHNVGLFEFLKLFLTEEFFNTMVNKTNKYAEKVFCIFAFLHFGDNDKTYIHRLGKVKYLVDHLNSIMKDIYDQKIFDHMINYLGVGFIFANKLKRRGASMA